MWIVLLTILTIWRVSGEPVVRQNIGVLYEQLPGQLITGHDYHELILMVPYNIPDIPQPKPPIEGLVRKLQVPILGPVDSASAKLIQQAKDLDRLLATLQNDIVATMKNVLHFLSDPINSRTKRAILSFLGELFKTVFGLATTADLESILAKINDLDSKVGKLADTNIDTAQGLHDLAQQHNSLMDTYIKDQDAMAQALLNITEAIDSWTDDFSTTLTTIQGEQDRIAAQSALVSAQTVVLLTKLAYHQGLASIETSLRLLSTGTLAPDIIRPTELAIRLDDLNTHLRVNNPGSEVTIMDTAYYYSQPVSLYTYSSTHLYIHIKVIISSTDSAFNLFQVITTEVPIDTEDTNGTGVTRMVTDDLRFLGVNYAETLFLELTNADLLACPGTILKVCARTIPRIRSDTPTCLMAAFSNNRRDITRLCSFQIQPLKPIRTQAIAIGKDSYLVTTNQRNYHVICQHKTPSTKQATAYAVVGVPCNCHLQFHGLFLPNTRIPCNESTSTHFLMHTVNMPVIFSLAEDTINISSSSLHHNPIIIPHLHTEAVLKTINPHNMMPKDAILDLTPFTTRILEEAKATAIDVHKPLSVKPAVDGVVSFFSHSAWNYITPVLTLINSIVLVVLIFKTLGRGAVFTALPTASAKPFNITWRHVKSAKITVSPTEVPHIDNYIDAENIFTVILIAIILYFMVKLCRTCKRRISNHFGISNSTRKTNPTITLKVYNGSQNHTIPLLDVPYEMDAIKTHITPSLIRITTSLCPHPMISMIWSAPVTLEINAVSIPFCLPQHVVLSLKSRFSVIPALRDPTNRTALVLKTNDITVSMPVTPQTEIVKDETDGEYQTLMPHPSEMTTTQLLTAIINNGIAVGNEN